MRTLNLTQIFLTTILSPVSCQIKNTCTHVCFSTFLKFEEIWNEMFRNSIYCCKISTHQDIALVKFHVRPLDLKNSYDNIILHNTITLSLLLTLA